MNLSTDDIQVRDDGGLLPEERVVLFTLSGCELGIPIHLAREIIRVPDITRMPKAPAFLEGVINLRGRIIPVLDLKKRFDMPLLDRTEETRILIVQLKDQSMGLLVDKVTEVLRYALEAVVTPKESILNIGVDYTEGFLMIGTRLVTLLKMERVFNVEEMKPFLEK